MQCLQKLFVDLIAKFISSAIIRVLYLFDKSHGLLYCANRMNDWGFDKWDIGTLLMPFASALEGVAIGPKRTKIYNHAASNGSKYVAFTEFGVQVGCVGSFHELRKGGEHVVESATS